MSQLLKDKNGNPPSISDRILIENLDRKLLFPCSRSLDELAIPMQATAPKEMNRFMVFRRQVAFVAKQTNLIYDGKCLSRVAAYIWYGASEIEKQGYALIAKELKRRHNKNYPNYTEKRKRKPAFVFKVYTAATMPRKPQVSAESGTIQNNVPLAAPVLSQEQKIEIWNNPSLTGYVDTTFDHGYPMINDCGVNDHVNIDSMQQYFIYEDPTVDLLSTMDLAWEKPFELKFFK